MRARCGESHVRGQVVRHAVVQCHAEDAGQRRSSCRDGWCCYIREVHDFEVGRPPLAHHVVAELLRLVLGGVGPGQGERRRCSCVPHSDWCSDPFVLEAPELLASEGRALGFAVSSGCSRWEPSQDLQDCWRSVGWRCHQLEFWQVQRCHQERLDRQGGTPGDRSFGGHVDAQVVLRPHVEGQLVGHAGSSGETAHAGIEVACVLPQENGPTRDSAVHEQGCGLW
mmetsp:Transcript_24260/g.68826  ORF Transcript_24260/g.68826 Transcript_24260/m.68826 type:complete len:225 (+) Transcript_24260:224-898(+)